MLNFGWPYGKCRQIRVQNWHIYNNKKNFFLIFFNFEYSVNVNICCSSVKQFSLEAKLKAKFWLRVDFIHKKEPIFLALEMENRGQISFRMK